MTHPTTLFGILAWALILTSCTVPGADDTEASPPADDSTGAVEAGTDDTSAPVNAIERGNGADQSAWVPGAIAGLGTTWKLAYGHHPYLSNGEHGNAEANIAAFVEDNLCGQVDVYLSGHDHDLQWMEPTCGTEFIVSGGGSSARPLVGSDATLYEAESLGFLWVEIDGNTFTGVYYDENANELFRRSFTK